MVHGVHEHDVLGGMDNGTITYSKPRGFFTCLEGSASLLKGPEGSQTSLRIIHKALIPNLKLLLVFKENSIAGKRLWTAFCTLEIAWPW